MKLLQTEKKAFKIENDTHAVEQLRLTVIDKEALNPILKFIFKIHLTAFSATDDAGFWLKTRAASYRKIHI
jgi:hypothetical protein